MCVYYKINECTSISLFGQTSNISLMIASSYIGVSNFLKSLSIFSNGLIDYEELLGYFILNAALFGFSFVSAAHHIISTN